MKSSTRIILLLIALALLPVIVKLQGIIDPQRPQFQPGKGVGSMVTEVGNNPVVMPSQFVAGTLIGFREVVAGLLWVRADEFFHTGNYEAIIPLTRIITWLDPHQIDVYRVGSWHLAYNLVDSSQRADARYILPAIKFLEEGIANNPGVSDVEFDLGFLIYGDKVQDYHMAHYWVAKACTEKDAIYPMFRQIAHTLQKDGQVDACIQAWRNCLAQAQAALKKNAHDWRAQDHMLVSKRNLDMMLLRKMWRKDLYKHPVDIGFDAHFKRLGPRQFRISGTANLPTGSRVALVLRDADYKEPSLKNFRWDLDPNVTILSDIGVHGLFIDHGKFRMKYDLTKDQKQYPFKKDKYVLVLTINPRNLPDEAQDRLGWNGEALTDKKYLDTSVPGLRQIRKVIYLTREDLL